MFAKVLILVACLGYINAKGLDSFLKVDEPEGTEDFVTTLNAFATLNTETGYDWPNDSCDVLAEINHLRSDPVGFADQYLVPMLDKFSPYEYNGSDYFLYDSEWGGILTHEGEAAVQECIDALKDPNLPAMEPLAYSDELNNAAQGMADAQGPTGQTGHTGPDGSTMSQRVMEAFGYDKNAQLAGGISENIAYRYYTANMSILNLIIDDGVPSRGHRVNLLNPSWTHAGIGQGAHAGYDWMQVQNFSYGFDVAASTVCPGTATDGGDASADTGSDDTAADDSATEDTTGSDDTAAEDTTGSDDTAAEEETVVPSGPVPSTNPVPIQSAPPADWPADAYNRQTYMGVTCSSYESCTLTTTTTYFYRPVNSGLKVIYEEKSNHTYQEIMTMFGYGFVQISSESEFRD